MSKSKGNAMAPAELVERFGVDGYRYYFLRDVQFGTDGSISLEGMVQRYNSDLANDWGNLCSRLFNMVGQVLRRARARSGGCADRDRGRRGTQGDRARAICALRGAHGPARLRGRARGGVGPRQADQPLHRGQRAVEPRQVRGDRRPAACRALQRARGRANRRALHRAGDAAHLGRGLEAAGPGRHLRRHRPASREPGGAVCPWAAPWSRARRSSSASSRKPSSARERRRDSVRRTLRCSPTAKGREVVAPDFGGVADRRHARASRHARRSRTGAGSCGARGRRRSSPPSPIRARMPRAPTSHCGEWLRRARGRCLPASKPPGARARAARGSHHRRRPSAQREGPYTSGRG